MVFRKVQDPQCGVLLRVKVVCEKLLKSDERQAVLVSGCAFVETAKVVTRRFLNWPDLALEEEEEAEGSRNHGAEKPFANRRLAIQTGIFVVRTFYSCNTLIPLYRGRI